MKKGSMSIGAVVLLVIGIVAAAMIIGGVLGPSTDQYNNASMAGAENASNNTDYATCVANCRENHPGDRSAFITCRESNDCAPGRFS